MYVSARLRLRLLLLLTLLTFMVPAFADNVTISGTVNFSSLDGSSLDHDGAANGVFTVDDGDLTVLGTVNCNDDGAATNSACNMSFAVSGNVLLQSGSALYAENRKGPGDGGSINVTAGGTITVSGPSGAQAGAIISSGNSSNAASADGGAIALNAGGGATFQAGSVVSAAASGGRAGSVTIDAGAVVDVRGLIASGPSSTVSTSTRYTGVVLAGGSAAATGGDIVIRSSGDAEPAIVVSGDATVVSQGGKGGSGTVVLEGCGIAVNGLVATVSSGGVNAKVTVRSGTFIALDGSDLAGAGSRRGMVRADALLQDAGSYSANFYAREAVTILGAASGSLYAVTSNDGTTSKGAAGTINVMATEGTVAASGNAFSATGTNPGDQGGRLNIDAEGDINLDTARAALAGDHASGQNAAAGGKINVRSYSGGISWQNGTGDVRPVGSAATVPAAQQGTISLTYCTTVSTTGSTFPTNGSAVGAFPATAQACSPAAPTLPAGEVHPDCNDAPIVADDAYTVAEGDTLNVPAPGVLANDVDPDGDPFTAVLVSGPAHASSFTFNADGSFSYTHDGSENHADSFTYEATDGQATSSVATVSLTITPVNDAPVATNDSYSVDEAGTINFAAPGVLANDTDSDGPAMSAVLVSGPAHASSFVLNADGSFIYVHDGSETTADSFTYKASDGSLDSNVATASIVITPVNDAPVANDDSASTNEGGTINGASVLANDTDAENDSLSAVLVSGPANAASFTLNADGTYTYVHDGGETTSDSFTYKANDGQADSNVATVSIAVAAVNDAPVANDDSASTNEGGTINGASVLGNDTDAENGSLTAVLVSAPANASSFTLNADGTYTYVHDGSETTSDSFTYKASDGAADSNVATVTIAIAPVNDAPVAVADSATVAEGGSVSGAVLGNDTDAENDTLTAVLVSGPANASSFTLNADGTFTYVHDGGETTSDSFTYKANDGQADSNTVTVSITITAVNDAPVAVADSASVNEGGTVSGSVLGNDTDAENDTLTAVLVSGPANASSFTLNADGTFTYTHDGSETTSDSFTYKANDGQADSNTVTVSITITAVNDAPVAVADSATVAEGGTVSGAVLGNDTDAENDALTAVLVSGPANASSFVLNADGTFTYTHNGGETTSDSFTYKANDGQADSNVVTVSIAITAVNDAPVAVADAATVAEGGTVSGAVLGNDTDAENDALSAVLVSGPANASSFVLNADGTFTYTHNGGETTSDSFTYKANDGQADSNVVTVTIAINAVNDAPVAVAEAYSVNEGDTLSVPAPGVLGNDTDADSASLTAVLVSGPANASSFTLNADGSFTYVHNGSETTSDSFTYKANDGSADSNTVTVTISISAVNDAPVASPDAYNATSGQTLNVPAPGVLGNDTDADGPSLTAVLVSGPANATTFSLNADGSFSYSSNTEGTDSFTYYATDGLAQSNTVTVTIDVVSLPPVANDDVFQTVGNTELRVGAGSSLTPHVAVSGSVLANDTDPDTPPTSLVVTSFDPVSANGGSVTMTPAGNFTYVPPAGNTANDSFNYTVSDGVNTDNGNVTITFTGRVWYVNNAAALGDGRSTSPFTNLAAAQTASLANDYIYVDFGTGTSLNYSGGITLQNTQRLIGEGVALVVGPYTLAPAGSRPTIGGVVLGSGNTVAGLNVTASGTGISGSSVTTGTIASVDVTGGADGVTLTNASGTFTLTNVVLAPGGIGLAVTGGSANVTASGLSVTTSGATGIVGTGTGTLTISGSVASTNAGAIDLSNHNLAITLSSVNASNGVNGIRLVNTTGTFTSNGGTIQGMSSRAVSGQNAANIALSSMTFSNSGERGVFVQNALSGASTLNVQSSTFTGSFSNALQGINTGAGTMTVTSNGNTFTSNNAAVVASTTLGPLTVKATNNVTTFNSGTAFNISRSSSGNGLVQVTLTGNRVGATGVPNSGAVCGGGCGAVSLSSAGTNAFHALVANNQVFQIDSIGIRALANQGSSQMNVTITNNSLTEPVAGALHGVNVQSGSLSADTTAMCASITGNTVSGGFLTDVAVRNTSAGSTFSLPGYTGLGTDTTAVANFIKANNTITTATATRKTTAPANQFSGGAACATPAP